MRELLEMLGDGERDELPARRPDLPAWVGRFRPIRRLRSGPLLESFVARADGAADLVTLARIQPSLHHVADARALFAHEAHVLARLDHPSIIRAVDVEPSETDGHFATEFVRGHRLDDIVRRAEQLGFRMPLRHGISIVASIAEALHHAHDATDDDGRPLEVVHAGVCAASVVVLAGGAVKVTDFGAARSRLLRTRGRTRPSVGPVTSMSPEQSRGEAIERRSDVYSLGIMLWELATWSRLYRRLAPEQIIARVAIGAVPLPSQIRADIPAELEDAIMIALQPVASRRFSSAGEFARVLRRLGGAADPRGLDAWIRRMFH